MRIEGFFCNGLPNVDVERVLCRPFGILPVSVSFGASAAYILQPFRLLASRNTSGLLTDIIDKVSAAPADALRVIGEKGAQCLVETTTESTPKKKAVRKIPPMFPGSSCQWISMRCDICLSQYSQYHPGGAPREISKSRSCSCK